MKSKIAKLIREDFPLKETTKVTAFDIPLSVVAETLRRGKPLSADEMDCLRPAEEFVLSDKEDLVQRIGKGFEVAPALAGKIFPPFHFPKPFYFHWRCYWYICWRFGRPRICLRCLYFCAWV